jgi:hypothetical protein
MVVVSIKTVTSFTDGLYQHKSTFTSQRSSLRKHLLLFPENFFLLQILFLGNPSPKLLHLHKFDMRDDVTYSQKCITRTHTHTFVLTPLDTHIHYTHTRTFTHTFTYTHTHTLSHTHSLTHTCKHTSCLSVSLCLLHALSLFFTHAQTAKFEHLQT